MDMSQCQIVQTRVSHLRLCDGIVGRILQQGIPMEQGDVIFLVALQRESFQQGIAVHGSKGSAVNAASKFRQRNALHHRACKDMHMLRPCSQRPGSIRRIEIMIARGNKHWDMDLGQGLFQQAYTLCRGHTVKDIAG